MVSTSFIRRVRVLGAVGLAAATASLVAGVTPASAGLGLSCPGATSKPFAQWSDYANYAFVPDGGFEAGGAGWSFGGGARVVGENEIFFIHGANDRNSLSLPAGGYATSPQMCISLLSTKMRFVLKGDPGAKVKVQIIYRGLLSSVLGVLDGGTVSASGKWQPSPSMGMLGGLLPLLTQSVQFRFVAVGGSVQVDDVYLDPMKSA